MVRRQTMRRISGLQCWQPALSIRDIIGTTSTHTFTLHNLQHSHARRLHKDSAFSKHPRCARNTQHNTVSMAGFQRGFKQATHNQCYLSLAIQKFSLFLWHPVHTVSGANVYTSICLWGQHKEAISGWVWIKDLRQMRGHCTRFSKHLYNVPRFLHNKTMICTLEQQKAIIPFP